MHQATRRLTTTRLASLLLAALLLAACTGDSDADTPEATPTAATTSTASATPTSTTTPPPESDTNLPPGLAPSPPDTWQRLDLTPGDKVPDTLGVFIADATTGAGTLWSLNPSHVDNPDYVIVDVSAHGNYVTAGRHLLNTANGDSVTHPTNSHLIVIDDRGLALFQSASACRFWAVNLVGPRPVLLATLEVTENSNCNVAAVFSPDASELLLAIAASDSNAASAAFVIDLETGEPLPLPDLVVPGYVVAATTPSNTEVALLTVSLPGVAWVASYRWSDGTLTTTSIETGAIARKGKAPRSPGPLLISPDGRSAAWADSDDLSTGLGAGGEAEWPVVVIASIQDATPVVRAQRVALTNGIVTFHWLPDSSALVVQSEDGFALLTPAGVIQQLPFPVAFHSDPVPIPAPDALNRFAYDGRVVDRAGRELGQVSAVEQAWNVPTTSRPWSWWFGTSYAWGATADRLVFLNTAVPTGDFGSGGVSTLGLPPRIVTGPAAATPDQPIRLRVVSDGDNLNVRAAPGLAAERIGQFAHGTLVTLVRDSSIEHCGDRGCSILDDPDESYGESWWPYVRDETGTLEGWATSEFVEWAD